MYMTIRGHRLKVEVVDKNAVPRKFPMFQLRNILVCQRVPANLPNQTDLIKTLCICFQVEKG